MCYKCGGPFHPLLQCPDKQLKLMVLDEDETEEGDGKIVALEVEEEEDIDGECSTMSLGSLIEEKGSKPQTVKLKGMLGGVPVLILVDSGATHNFISKKLVTNLGWPVEDTRPLTIQLGDGHHAVARGKYVKELR